jgi:alpha-L-arabinofuranosidase
VLPVELNSPVVEDEPLNGSIGVGTWMTQAEYKDIKVTRNGETLFEGDFSGDTSAWKFLTGDWKMQDGALKQNSKDANIRAIAGDKTWSDYTYSLKARKLGGAEGFLILFNVRDNDQKSWWNIGGWGNSKHAIEMDGVVDNGVSGSVETGRWYDIRIELKGGNIKCYLDGKLIHDVNPSKIKSLYASASRSQADGGVILKVVNVSNKETKVNINLKNAGPLQTTGTAIVLSANSTDENTLAEPKKVSPKESNIEISGPEFNFAFKPCSLTVLKIGVGK